MDELLETAPCGFLEFGDDGIILLTNATLRDALGYAPSELEGRHLEIILSVGGRVFYQTHFFPLLKMQGRAEEIYFSLRSKNGEDIPVLANGVRRPRDGSAVYDCVFVRIRQRHRYEDELLRARKAAEHASEAKARFLSMMSHDLRTPLQSISGYTEVLLHEMHGAVNEEQHEDLQAIKSASQEMLRLMNDILGFAQLESGRVAVRIATVPLREALDRAEALLSLRFQQNSLTFVRSTSIDDIAVAADADRLQQVLLNLLTNAIKFTPEGGQISVDCEVNGDRVRIHVRDTGIGIPSDRIAEIFEPFVQAHDELGSRGVGLGLAISRELIRAMAGELTATSTVGQGSVFTVTLPLARHESTVAAR